MNTTNGISLDGRKALITGGASGIGAACARAFSRAGAHVTICDLNEDAARDLAAEVNGDHWAWTSRTPLRWRTSLSRSISWSIMPVSNVSPRSMNSIPRTGV
ncbi:3-hydroxybutyrate dehydrogenase [Corynebacterium efficiens YS-314]|nr:3-hydroxybutyrate dehydrogenase [Corynebacterium efficiens YS-314]